MPAPRKADAFPYLTGQARMAAIGERACLLMADGMLFERVAAGMGLSEHTLALYIRIYRKAKADGLRFRLR